MDLLVIVPTQLFLLLLIPRSKWHRHISGSILTAYHESDLARWVSELTQAIERTVRGDRGVCVFCDREDV